MSGGFNCPDQRRRWGEEWVSANECDKEIDTHHREVTRKPRRETSVEGSDHDVEGQTGNNKHTRGYTRRRRGGGVWGVPGGVRSSHRPVVMEEKEIKTKEK